MGMLTGFTGVGPGLVTAPALLYVFGLAAARAQSSSLVLMLAAAALGVPAYALAGHVDWLLAGPAAAGAIVGALAGAKLTGGRDLPIVRRIVAIALIAGGTQIIIAAQHAGAGVTLLRFSAAVSFSVGLASGLIGGVAGIASGALLVPALTIFCGAPQKLAQAAALAAVIFASVPGVLIHFSRGTVDRRAAGWLAAGAGLGGCVGAAMAVRTAPALLAGLFGIFLVVISVAIFSRG